MRSRSVTVALLLAALCGAGAGASWFQARRLRTDAGWLLERGSAQAQQYTDSFDGQYVDRQLGTFEQRRVVLDRAHLFQRIQLLLVLAAVVFAFSAYVLFLFRRLRDQLVEGTGGGVTPREDGHRRDGPSGLGHHAATSP